MEAALEKVLESEQVDVVHIHHFAHTGFGLAELAARKGFPVVFHLHDYHSICVRGQLVNRDLARCSGPEESKCAGCVLEHLRARRTTHVAGRIAAAIGVRKAARDWIGSGTPSAKEKAQIQARFQASRIAFRHIHRFLSPSQDLAQRMHTAGGAPKDRIFVEDLPLNAPLALCATVPTGPLQLLFVGSLIPTKGPQILLAAAQDLDCEVSFFGPTPGFDGQPDWGENLVRQIETQKNARYGGVFQAHERAVVYGAADVFILPSTWEENSPLVLREALAAGLPIIASRIGGIPELAPEAQWIPPDSIPALQRAIKSQIDRGRYRNAPKDWPMKDHTKALQRHYCAALARHMTDCC
jgi:glycosyltransferase involved in cell wall biosynthesis